MLSRIVLPIVGAMMMTVTGCGQAVSPLQPNQSRTALMSATTPTADAAPTTAQLQQTLVKRLTVNSGQFYGAFGTEQVRVTMGPTLGGGKVGFKAEMRAGSGWPTMNFNPQPRLVKIAGTFDATISKLTITDRGRLTEKELWYFRVGG